MFRKTRLLFVTVLLIMISVLSFTVLADDFTAVTEPTPPPRRQVPNIKLVDPTNIVVDYGKKVKSVLTFTNVSPDTAFNVFYEVSQDSTAPFLISFTDKSYIDFSLGGRSDHKVNIEINTSSDAKSGTYPITVKYTYKNYTDEAFEGSSVVYVKVNGIKEEESLLILDKFSVDKPIMPNTDFTVSAALENKKAVSVYNAQVVIDGLATDKVWSTNSKNGNNFYKDIVKAGDVTKVTFNLHADEKCPSGSYELKFKVLYDDGKGKNYENAYTYYVTVGEKKSSSNLSISFKDELKTAMKVEEKFNVTAIVKNDGDTTLKNITVLAKSTEETMVVPMSTNTNLISELKSGESKEFTYTFMGVKAATTQNYVINVTATCKNGDLDVLGSNYTGANISNPVLDKKADDTTKKDSVPKIIVSKYSVSPEVVYAGKPFELNMEFLNTSKISSVNNIKVSLTVDSSATETGNIFSPVNGSNTFYIDKIATGGKISKKLTLQPDYNAKAKTYDINVNMAFEDANNNPIEEKEIIGVKVNQIVKLEWNPPVFPETIMPGQPGQISFQFYNTGKVDLNNLKIKTVGDFDLKDSDVFYGKFPVGSSDYYDVNIGAKDEGEQAGQVVITYEDETGKELSQSIDFKVQVAAGGADGSEQMNGDGTVMGADGMPQNGNGMGAGGMDPVAGKPINKKFLYGGIAGAVIVIGGIIALLIRRKRKKGVDFYE